MGIVFVFIAAVASIGLGFVLGSTPGLNEHLHWNLWYILPVSGLLFGCLCGAIQFLILFFGNQRALSIVKVILVISAVTGYLAVDYGIYRSMTFEISGQEGIQDGRYKLSELITFEQYLRINLGSTSTTTRSGMDIEFGAVGSTISYIADLLGAALGTLGVLLMCYEVYPYCLSCRKYKKHQKRYLLEFVNENNLLNTILSRFHELGKAAVHQDILAYCTELQQQYQSKVADTRIQISQRACPVCAETTFLGDVSQKNSKKEWTTINELKFCLTSKPRSQAGQTIAEGTQFMREV